MHTETDYQPVTLEAHSLVFGDRNVSYGHPLDDFACTAACWTAYLRHRGLLAPGAELVAEDVGPLMIYVKLSRQANCPKRDNPVDIAGYAETTERVIHERASREAFDAEIAGYRDLMAETGVTEADMQPVKPTTDPRVTDLFERFGVRLREQAAAQGDKL